MITSIILLILFAFLVDGIKVLFESFFKYKKKHFLSDHSQVSVVIPLYNEERTISAVVRKAMELFSSDNIIVVDDGSTDDSLNAVMKMAHKGVRIFSTKNQGKVRAIEMALPHVKTKYTLLLDSDVFLPNTFRCPTSLIRDRVTAVAFNVMPGHGDWNSVLKFQSYEYAKSMKIGKRYQDKTNSISCVSGAIGLFKTKRLITLTKKHSKIWAGEDFERTLIELVASREITFVDQLIETEVPKTFSGLIKQRILGWWPGLWRNIPFLFKILFKKRTPLQLRGEMAYLLFSLFTDPLKIIVLTMLILKNNWNILIALYLTYLTLEILIWTRIRTQSFMAVVLFFFYNLLQIILRIFGLMYYILGKFVQNRWTSTVIGLVCMMLLFSFNSFADNTVFATSYQQVMDSNGRKLNNLNFYIGYRDFYLDINTTKGAPRYLILGRYIKHSKTLFIPEMRLGEHYKSIHLTVKYPTNRVVLDLSVAYTFSDEGNYPIVKGGFDYYWGDRNWSNVNVVKELGRKRATTLVLKNHFEYGHVCVRAEFVVNNFLDTGWSIAIGFKRMFVIYSSFHNFDYYDFDRKYLGIGIKFKF